MPCTIGAVSREGRTLVLKNFDYDPVGLAWTLFTGDGYDHFGLVNHAQQGINLGINTKGLTLVIAWSDTDRAAGSWGLEKRTLINSDILSHRESVEEAIRVLEDYVAANPDMIGGNVILADPERIAAVEYYGGTIKYEVKEEGHLARANHSIFRVVENQSHPRTLQSRSLDRYRAMDSSLRKLYEDLPTLTPTEAVERCKGILESEPILNSRTRASCVIDTEEISVYHKVIGGEWRKWTP